MYKHELIYEDVKNKILNGNYAYGQKIPSEAALCKLYSASRVTVNTATIKLAKKNFISRRVGDGSYVIYQKSEDCEKFASYVMLGNGPENNEIIGGMRDELSKKKVRLTVFVANDDISTEQRILNHLNENGIEGIICYPSMNAKNDMWKSKQLKDVPVIFLDRYPDNMICSSVQSNSYGGMYEMTEYVIQSGHKNIAYFTMPPASLVTMRERLDAFLDCMKAHDLPCQNGYISILPPLMRPYGEDDYFPNILSLLNRTDRPSVIVCANDMLAHACMKVAKTLGLSVPEDISLTGFDDIFTSAHSDPPLTTMRQNFYEMGRNAAQLLCKNIFDRDKTVVKLYLETKLIERESVKTIR